MKTIEISDNCYDFIKNLAKEMKEQSNRATQDVGFMVMNTKRHACTYDDDWSSKERIECEQEEFLCEDCLKIY